MKFKAISFDLQGTLSDSKFSDEFWLDLLPKLYSEAHSISIADAKSELWKQFSAMGKYDRRYYCPRHWVAELCPNSSPTSLFSKLAARPHLYPDTLELVQELSQQVPLIILSTTTRDFIEAELGSASQHFQNVYSTLDDFQTAGKTPEIFNKVAAILNCAPQDLLHIGDCKEMDIANGNTAGWNTFFFDKKRPRTEIVSELVDFLS